MPYFDVRNRMDHRERPQIGQIRRGVRFAQNGSSSRVAFRARMAAKFSRAEIVIFGFYGKKQVAEFPILSQNRNNNAPVPAGHVYLRSGEILVICV